MAQYEYRVLRSDLLGAVFTTTDVGQVRRYVESCRVDHAKDGLTYSIERRLLGEWKPTMQSFPMEKR